MRTRIPKTALVVALGVVALAGLPAANAFQRSSSSTVAQTSAPTVAPGTAELNLVFVLDGLRPDSINAIDTPNLFRLRNSGVNFPNSHSVAPTVTRLNSSAIGSGNYPTSSGLIGNAMYVPAVDPARAFSTGDARQLMRLREATGRIVLSRTLGERLEDEGKTLVAMGSGSSGGTLLLNPAAPDGAGVMINGDDPVNDSPLAYPAEVGDEVLARFGPPPRKAGLQTTPESVNYIVRVLNEYVLTDLKPEVVLTWLTEPDGVQHATGAGSPQSIAAIANDDRNIGLVLARLEELGLSERTNMIFVSDHGFSLTSFGINLERDLIEAGLKAGPGSDDVVVADTGSSLVYVKDRDPARIAAITEFLSTNKGWIDTIYTAAEKPVDGKWSVVDKDASLDDITGGWVDGTFSLELIHEAHPVRGADILVTYPWDSARNAYGVPGRAETAVGGLNATGPISGPVVGVANSNHGSFSPWDITNTFFAWGADFKDGDTSLLPAGNVDIAPTLLSLTGVAGADELDGRVLVEAMNDGPQPSGVVNDIRVLRTNRTDGTRPASVQVSSVYGSWYIDLSQRTGPE